MFTRSRGARGAPGVRGHGSVRFPVGGNLSIAGKIGCTAGTLSFMTPLTRQNP